MLGKGDKTVNIQASRDDRIGINNVIEQANRYENISKLVWQHVVMTTQCN